MIKMKPDDAFEFSNLLEPATLKMIGEENQSSIEIQIFSIAISLKRIADALTIGYVFT